MIKKITLILISTIVIAMGCAENQNKKSLLNYSTSAEQLFESGMREFEAEDCIDAEIIFMDVRKQYPYSKYASLSELRMADCHFSESSHAEAAVSYQHFVKVHPTHKEAHYAAFRRAESFYEMIPSEWLITPPSHERDQAATRDAKIALSSYIKNYPNSPYQDRAKELYIQVENALVKHEMYVAAFYIKRKKLKAAVVRLEGIDAKFPSSSLVPDAMFLQAITFLEMNYKSDAIRIFKEIIEHFPEHHQSFRSRDYLLYLKQHLDSTNRGNNG